MLLYKDRLKTFARGLFSLHAFCSSLSVKGITQSTLCTIGLDPSTKKPAGAGFFHKTKVLINLTTLLPSLPRYPR